jgi:hypothetical protein
MKFRDIKQFTRANYSVDIFWTYLEDWITSHNKGEMTCELEPDFQRGHVWSEDKQSKYIEFVLRGGRSGKDIYWNCTSWFDGFNSPIQLVDGLQRVTAVQRFLNNEIKVFGHFLNDFEDKPDLLKASFKFHVNDLKTRGEVLNWYIELNDGGVVHTPEEINRVRELLNKEVSK